MKSKNALSMVLGGIVLLLIGTYVFMNFSPHGLLAVPDESKVCALDVKECLDGSFVGRVAPTCEFSACPQVAGTSTPGFDVKG